MIAYLDTSALVPLMIDEPASEASREMWDAADSVVSVRLTYVEASAALAAAHRIGRISVAEFSHALELLDDLWRDIDVVEFDCDLAEYAAFCARTYASRGYDAVQCAAGLMLDDDDLVAVAGDAALVNVWQEVGLAHRNVAVA